MRTIHIKLFFLLFLLPIASLAQNPTKWTLESEVKGQAVKKDEIFKAVLKAEIEDGWHLYSLDQPKGGPVATTIKIADGKAFEITGDIDSPKPTIKPDPNFTISDKPLDTEFYEKQVSFGLMLKANEASSDADPAVDVRFQLCNDKVCLPPKTVRVSFSGSEDLKKSSLTGQQSSTVNSVKETNTEKAGSGLNDSKQQLPTDLWAFLWLAAGLGALSLLTPCVFPMIPITVSYFTNHSSGNRGKAVKLASVYSLGIIGTFTLIGMLLAVFVGAAGINLFAANPWINLLITAIFLFFAFNLFGAYEIAIPAGILTKLDSLTRSQEGEGSGIIGALLMGLTFSLTSFTCTSPFVGTILVSASQGDWQRPLLGMLAFSTIFALPFFLIALLPQLATQLPRAGGWMNSVKVAMGFLEVAAAMKFISNVDLVWKWGIFTRPIVLAIWIAIGIILSLYLLGKFQLSHDSKPDRIGAARLVSAIVSLAISFYLITGLFGAKLGELEAFLPPELETASNAFSKGKSEQLDWIVNDYPAALAKAKAENKVLFIDFTGYTCTNCRWMEANVFPKKEVEAELAKMILVRLYTDGDGEIYEKQQQMEQDNYGTVALPFYAAVDGNGKNVATFPGLTRNVNDFVDFLKQAQQN